MSIQRENVIPFIIDSKDNLVPIEAELAFVVGVVGDKIKKRGLFKKAKERLTQVSKFYWRITVDTYARRLILVDSLGLYGGGTAIQDLPLANIEAHLKAIDDATTLNAYSNSLSEANDVLVLSTVDYPVFDQFFTKTTLNLARKKSSEDMIDTPLILPSFENTISNDFLESQTEVTRLQEIQEIIQEMAQNWLADINDKTESIENEYANRINHTQEDVEERLENYEERMNTYIDSDLEKANNAIYKLLSKFEGSTLGLTGIITPLQEGTRDILRNIPSTETPKFHANITAYLKKAKNQTGKISAKVKDVENERKQLEKALLSIAQTHLNNKQKAGETYEKNRSSALSQVDELQTKRDRALSNLLNHKDSIIQNTNEIINKIETMIKNRFELAKNATVSSSGNVPSDIIISAFLVKFQDKDKSRYFVIPPLSKPRSRHIDYPIADRNSAISGGKETADKLAAEIVFNRRLKSSFDALNATNYIKTGEFAGAVRQGLAYLMKNKMMSKKNSKKIIDLLNELGF